MSEIAIRISKKGDITVEENINGIKNIKHILPEVLTECIENSTTQVLSSGLLPRGCIAYGQYENGDINISMLFQDKKADVSYYKTDYKDFPLPQLVFGFRINGNRIVSSKLGVIDYTDVIRPSMQMYVYPFSNVRGFHLCTGNNVMPKSSSLYKLTSIPYFILSMPNNDDYFKSYNNKKNMEM